MAVGRPRPSWMSNRLRKNSRSAQGSRLKARGQDHALDGDLGCPSSLQPRAWSLLRVFQHPARAELEVAGEVIDEKRLRGEGFARHGHAHHPQHRRQGIGGAVGAESVRRFEPGFNRGDGRVVEMSQDGWLRLNRQAEGNLNFGLRIGLELWTVDYGLWTVPDGGRWTAPVGGETPPPGS